MTCPGQIRRLPGAAKSARSGLNAASLGRVRGDTKSYGSVGQRPRIAGREISSLKPNCSCPRVGALLTSPRSSCSTFMPWAASSAASFFWFALQPGEIVAGQDQDSVDRMLGATHQPAGGMARLGRRSGIADHGRALGLPKLEGAHRRSRRPRPCWSALQDRVALRAMLRSRMCAASGSFPSCSFMRFHTRWASRTIAAEHSLRMKLVEPSPRGGGVVYGKEDEVLVIFLETRHDIALDLFQVEQRFVLWRRRHVSTARAWVRWSRGLPGPCPSDRTGRQASFPAVRRSAIRTRSARRRS